MVPTLLSLLITAAAGVVNATPIPRSDVQPCWTTYISLPGETCETIAMAFHITTTDVIQANTFLNCNDIWPGTPICVYGKSQVTVTGIPPVAPTTIPGGATCWANYRSVLGDTCDSIGSRFGITPDDVYKYNTFLNCNDIWDGTPISICVGEGTRTRTTVVNTPTAFPPSPTNACGTIRSLEGDTCDTIANRFQITAAEVYNRNSFVDCNNIWTNTPIVVCGPPPPVNFCWTTYSEEGDTCDIIANRLGISSADVWDKNRFVDCNNIWTHTPLVICARTSSTLAPTTTIAATPACQTVLSNPGDTCESIGARVQLSASEIYNHNTFLNCNDIWPNTPIDICRSSWPLETIVDVLNDLFPSGAARPTSLSSTVEGTTTSSSSSAEEYVIPTISPSSSTAEYVVPTPSSSSSSSAQEYVVPTSSSSVAEYVVPTSSSSSVQEYVVPTPSSSSAEEYVVPTSSSSAAEYVVPTSSSSSAEEYVAPTSSSSVLEYVVPIEYIAPVRL